MNIFKKKVEKKNSANVYSKNEDRIKMTIEDLPTNAIEFTYEELQRKYQEYPDQGVQQKLVYLSRILTDRATNSDGVTNLAKEASSFFPAISKEMIDKMTDKEKINLENLITDMKNMKKSITNLATKGSIEVRTDDDSFRVSVDDDLLQKIEDERSIKKKQVEQVYEKALVKPKFSFFKKKKLVEDNSIQNQLLKTLESQPSIPQPSTPNAKQIAQDIQKELRITENAKKLKEATERSINVLRKKKEEKPDKPSFKNMEDIYCNNCKHPIKSHQNGCNKCGCLVTIDEIAEAHGIQLYKPKDILQKIEEEYQETLTPETYYAIPEVSDELEIEKIIQKQASQLASMSQPTANKFPSLTGMPESISSMVPPVQKKNNIIHNPEHKVVGDVNCTCDHEKSHHYFNGTKYEFCTNNACLCSEFIPYPT